MGWVNRWRFLSAVALQPGDKTVREAWILPDLAYRLAFTKSGEKMLYTSEQMKEWGVEWISDVVRGGMVHVGMKVQPDPGCYAIVDGGPKIAKISELTIDEVESVEIYAGSGRSLSNTKKGNTVSLGAMGNVGRLGVSSTSVSSPQNNLERLSFANFMLGCPTVYVWTR